MALVHHREGNHHKSLEYHTKALEIQQTTLGEHHQNTALSFHNIGDVHYYNCEYVQAIASYLRAVSIREEVLKKNHPDIAVSFNRIGWACFKKGNDSNAVFYSTKELVLLKAIYGEKDERVIERCQIIGEALSKGGHNDLALDNYTKALEIHINLLETDIHPSTFPSVHQNWYSAL